MILPEVGHGSSGTLRARTPHRSGGSRTGTSGPGRAKRSNGGLEGARRRASPRGTRPEGLSPRGEGGPHPVPPQSGLLPRCRRGPGSSLDRLRTREGNGPARPSETERLPRPGVGHEHHPRRGSRSGRPASEGRGPSGREAGQRALLQRRSHQAHRLRCRPHVRRRALRRRRGRPRLERDPFLCLPGAAAGARTRRPVRPLLPRPGLLRDAHGPPSRDGTGSHGGSRRARSPSRRTRSAQRPAPRRAGKPGRPRLRSSRSLRRGTALRRRPFPGGRPRSDRPRAGLGRSRADGCAPTRPGRDRRDGLLAAAQSPRRGRPRRESRSGRTGGGAPPGESRRGRGGEPGPGSSVPARRGGGARALRGHGRRDATGPSRTAAPLRRSRQSPGPSPAAGRGGASRPEPWPRGWATGASAFAPWNAT